ncbi:MAG: SoxR reducing system RseC family protein [Clostridia bacterium]|nr:SoxR reducing system RseC family protein [Clostridia bacterium]
MKHNAIVIKTDGDKATVTVLREEACSHCAGRVVCGTAKKFDVTVKNPVSAAVGDTVVIESASESVLAYSALVFLAPVALALVFYLIFSRVNTVLSVVMAVLGFVLPFIAAFIIDKRGREKRLPVITEILDSSNEAPPCDSGV